MLQTVNFCFVSFFPFFVKKKKKMTSRAIAKQAFTLFCRGWIILLEKIENNYFQAPSATTIFRLQVA